MKSKKLIISLIIFCIMLFLKNIAYGLTIVLDPGHGGTSPGAIAQNGEYESVLNLKIANYLKEYLKPYDVNVYLTESNMSVFDRGIYIRNQNADIGISLHLNSSNNSSDNGAEVWVTKDTSYDKYNKKSTELGNMILKNITALGIANRGVKTKVCNDTTDVYNDGQRADYYGIIRYSMRGCKIDKGVVSPSGYTTADVKNGDGVPSIIIEHCFVKGNDYQYINSDIKLKELAEADGKAIVDYYNIPLKRQKLSPFNDVYIDDWFADSVKYVYNYKIITGYSDETFAPSDKLTRGQVATILYRMEGKPKVTVNSIFPDVPSNSWCAEAVQWAYNEKIITGYTTTGTFGPDDNITRQDFIVMLQRYTDHKKKYDTTNLNNLEKFKDCTNVNGYAVDAMKWAVGNGIITGNNNGTTIDPADNATRAQAATMIMRFCKNIFGWE